MLTLEHDGVEKSFADWGIALEGASCLRQNLAPDIYRFSVPVANAATAPTFDFLDKIIIRRNRTAIGSGGHIAFVGYRLDPTHDIAPDAEFHHFTFGNILWLLSMTPFQQPTAQWVAGAVGFQFQTSLLMFTKISEGHSIDPDENPAQLPSYVIPITNGKQVKEILEHALEEYALQYPATDLAAPFQVGTIDPVLNLPADPAAELDCLAALQHALSLSPDCCVFVDYATDPPTIHARNRGGLTPVSAAIKNGVDFKSLRIMPLPTLQPSVVIVYFRITVDVDGEPRLTFARQKYGPNGSNSASDPDGGAFVVIQTVDLIGPTYASAVIATQAVVADDATTDPLRASVRAWWASVKPELLSTTIRNTSFSDTEIVDENDDPVDLDDYPNRLLDGNTLQSWMKLVDGTAVVGKRVKITATMTYDRYDTEGAEASTSGRKDEKQREMKLSWQGVLTNAVSGFYSAMIASGEEIPEGMAQSIYTSLATLQYQGEHIRVAAEVGNAVTMANTLNLTGGLAAWATMAAQIQQITEEEATGEVSVSIGPAKHLNSGDLAAIRKFNRARRADIALAARENAQP